MFMMVIDKLTHETFRRISPSMTLRAYGAHCNIQEDPVVAAFSIRLYLLFTESQKGLGNSGPWEHEQKNMSYQSIVYS